MMTNLFSLIRESSFQADEFENNKVGSLFMSNTVHNYILIFIIVNFVQLRKRRLL